VNYLSHAYRFFDNPSFIAGVAMPDWLRVVGREYRARRVQAVRCLTCPEWQDPDAISFLHGVIQHHDDDQRFHTTEVFVLLNAKLSVELRAIYGPESSIRSHFLAHIIIELLLDSVLSQTHESIMDRYYDAIRALDGEQVAGWAERITGKTVPSLAGWIERFCQERFLQDYQSNERLLFRLNQVLRRVKLDPIGSETLPWIASARRDVQEHGQSLLEMVLLAKDSESPPCFPYSHSTESGTRAR